MIPNVNVRFEWSADMIANKCVAYNLMNGRPIRHGEALV